MNRFKLYAHEPCAGDTTSYYRASGVLGALEHTTPWLYVQYTNDFHDWYNYNLDGFFLQRPFTAEHLYAMKLAKAAGNKVWIDYDDDLMTVNSDNPVHAHYENPKVRAVIKDIVTIADYISCTTEDLATALREYNDNVFVVPNALNDRLLKFHKVDYDKPREKKIFWRGGSSHERDLRKFQDIIISAIKEFPDWKWDFIGYKPWFIADEVSRLDNVKFTDWMNVLDFHKHLIKEENSLCIVPLADNEFNRSKSNIAWLESTYSGANTIVPNWTAWKAPGAMTYSDKNEFRENLLSYLKSPSSQFLAKTGWDHVKESLLLSKVNDERRKIIERMAG